jgi:hypothetical protein
VIVLLAGRVVIRVMLGGVMMPAVLLSAWSMAIRTILGGAIRLFAGRVGIGLMLGCVMLLLAMRVVIGIMLGGRCGLGWGPWGGRAVCVRICLVAVFVVCRAWFGWCTPLEPPVLMVCCKAVSVCVLITLGGVITVVVSVFSVLQV